MKTKSTPIPSARDYLNKLLDAVEPFTQCERLSAEQNRNAQKLRNAIGVFLEQERVKSRTTATRLASHLGICIPHLRDMEKGNRRYLPKHVLQAMAYFRANRKKAV